MAFCRHRNRSADRRSIRRTRRFRSSTINPFAAAALAGIAAPDNGNPLTNRSNNLEEIIPIKDYSR